MGTIKICNRMCISRIIQETFRRHSENAYILNTSNTNRSLHAFGYKGGNYPVNRLHSWIVQRLHGGMQVYSALCTNMPARNIRLRRDPDKFGDLDGDSSDSIRDEGDDIEDNYVTYPVPSSQQLRIKQYADIIKEHLQRKELRAAVNVVETRMVKEDRVKPDSYIYSLVISACGRFGETKQAFKLYKKMKDRGLKIHGSVYTALFNACALSSNPQDGLQRAIHLQNSLLEKGVELNSSHYNALMKAYGRCGDLGRAFQVADIMNDKQIPMYEDAFNFLLQACITDKQAGFRHALWVWHKMLQRNINPTIYTFNLMLRCVRDCAMGQYEDVAKSLQDLTLGFGSPLQEPIDHDSKQLVIEDGFPSERLPETRPRKNPVKSPWEFLPDLLSRAPKLGCDISSLDLTKPHERLLLLGGGSGFLRHMEKYNIAPSVKTYTLLLDCIPPTVSAEKNLISKMRKDGLPIDIEFCNMLIKKRSFRFDYSSAQDVLELIKQEKLVPDIVTFGVLALACTNATEALELIRNMKMAGYRMNVEILGAMLKQGCVRHNFKYVMKVLYLTKEENITPSPEFLGNIERLVQSSRSILKKQEIGDEIPTSLQKYFRKDFTTFMYKYGAWQKAMNEERQFHSNSDKQRSQ